MKAVFVAALLALAAGARAAPAFADPVQAAMATPDLSTLVDLVTLTGTGDVVAAWNGTIFAPTNEAFVKLLTAAKLTPADLPKNLDLVTTILLSHLVPDVKAFAADAEDGATLPTNLGVDLRVKNDGKTITIVAPGSEAKVVGADVEAGNAVIHVIDNVLLPTPL